jgi:DNA-binding response OmpR family regulator
LGIEPKQERLTVMAQPKILVIDDQLLNIRLLEHKLERSDMNVISSTNGTEGIRIAQEEKPDVILLDIMMPGLSGIEVCKLLKQDESTREIPVIFITARTSKEDKLEGFDVGAADYLIKPFELDETLARIKTQLRIIQEHQDNLRLTRQLEQSRRQSSIMHLTEGIAHNLNNLLGVMVGYLSLMKRNANDPEKIESNCDRMDSAIKRMTRIVQQLTVIGHFNSLKKQVLPLKKVLKGAVARFHRISGTDCPVTITGSTGEGFEFCTNREILEVCLERLLQNAFESYEEMEGRSPEEARSIELQVNLLDKEGASHIELKVLDNGKGIDPEIKDGIFEPFVTSSSVIGRGMGLTIARHSAQCLGGSIEVMDRDEGGVEAVVTLPLSTENEPEEE